MRSFQKEKIQRKNLAGCQKKPPQAVQWLPPKPKVYFPHLTEAQDRLMKVCSKLSFDDPEYALDFIPCMIGDNRAHTKSL